MELGGRCELGRDVQRLVEEGDEGEARTSAPQHRRPGGVSAMRSFRLAVCRPMKSGSWMEETKQMEQAAG